MKKEGAANQAGDDGEGYVDQFLFHVLSFKVVCSVRAMLLLPLPEFVHFQWLQARPSFGPCHQFL